MQEDKRACKRKESILPPDEVGKTKKMCYVQVTEAMEPLVLSTPAKVKVKVGVLRPVQQPGVHLQY